MTDEQNALLVDLTVNVVTSYLSNNHLAADQVGGLIESIHSSLASARKGQPDEIVAPVEKMTAAQARKLITPGGIVSLIDNRLFKSMRRHISTHGYTPESYREAFGLPADFPMVHPDYAASRSALAKSMGLGRKPAVTKARVKKTA